MDTPIAITESELLSALAAALSDAGPSEARTVAELAGTQGLTVERVRKALRIAARQGRLVVHRVRRTAIDGRSMLVPGYTLTPPTRPATRRRVKGRS